ncbi:MAG TPA: hypothetical protein VI874_01720, partial [Candidatus Norongarragalinales archaeon]|nr:hypothetical protein [Candidatus Norongarragalinales archaeon]
MMKKRRTLSGISIGMLLIMAVMAGCVQPEIKNPSPTPPSATPMIGQEVSVEKVTAGKIGNEGIENEEEDAGFDAPLIENARGWKQTSGPLGGTVVRMVPHGKTIWASLYSGGIYELQSDRSWKQIAVG